MSVFQKFPLRLLYELLKFMNVRPKKFLALIFVSGLVKLIDLNFFPKKIMHTHCKAPLWEKATNPLQGLQGEKHSIIIILSYINDNFIYVIIYYHDEQI